MSMQSKTQNVHLKSQKYPIKFFFMILLVKYCQLYCSYLFLENPVLHKSCPCTYLLESNKHSLNNNNKPNKPLSYSEFIFNSQFTKRQNTINIMKKPRNYDSMTSNELIYTYSTHVFRTQLIL
ncbi:hypothetical protein QTP88_028875 [Uroleucon formosanum]